MGVGWSDGSSVGGGSVGSVGSAVGEVDGVDETSGLVEGLRCGAGGTSGGSLVEVSVVAMGWVGVILFGIAFVGLAGGRQSCFGDFVAVGSLDGVPVVCSARGFLSAGMSISTLPQKASIATMPTIKLNAIPRRPFPGRSPDSCSGSGRGVGGIYRRTGSATVDCLMVASTAGSSCVPPRISWVV